MNFVMSYSCGKDSTLALHKMTAQGHKPVCLLVMVKEGEERAWFHGADRAMLAEYERALGIPMILCSSAGTDYHLAFEEGLRRAKAMGAQAACFGDIDIEANRQWEEARCQTAGLVPCFPLWQCGREACVDELISLNYRCLIKSLDKSLLPAALLGKDINRETVSVMKACGIDVCGENGEYHTLAVDGPLFKTPLAVQTGRVLELGAHAAIEIFLQEGLQPHAFQLAEQKGQPHF